VTSQVLGESVVSVNKTICLIERAQPYLEAKKGDRIRFVLVDGRLVIEKVVKKE
jgi:glutathione synthase/RimK-type ligase-like ATP-grasp enzyme